ncbi:uncharacterized protein [Triticum aestivum]|uniref:uncharacterized protein n=1 Tax=Triticum aestivum TaxID=4565 RepID=UPI001D00B165|nr:uncharacterized protein LOC123081956 [Triticum aestivum]
MPASPEHAASSRSPPSHLVRRPCRRPTRRLPAASSLSPASVPAASPGAAPPQALGSSCYSPPTNADPGQDLARSTPLRPRHRQNHCCICTSRCCSLHVKTVSVGARAATHHRPMPTQDRTLPGPPRSGHDTGKTTAASVHHVVARCMSRPSPCVYTKYHYRQVPLHKTKYLSERT